MKRRINRTEILVRGEQRAGWIEEMIKIRRRSSQESKKSSILGKSKWWMCWMMSLRMKPETQETTIQSTYSKS